MPERKRLRLRLSSEGTLNLPRSRMAWSRKRGPREFVNSYVAVGLGGASAAARLSLLISRCRNPQMTPLMSRESEKNRVVYPRLNWSLASVSAAEAAYH